MCVCVCLYVSDVGMLWINAYRTALSNLSSEFPDLLSNFAEVWLGEWLQDVLNGDSALDDVIENAVWTDQATKNVLNAFAFDADLNSRTARPTREFIDIHEWCEAAFMISNILPCLK